ncbi:hypothetical protein D1007_07082 [Hordeum vulgare]|nr:hypothetical protein D1007_07082 [Hordeum vulgare]
MIEQTLCSSKIHLLGYNKHTIRPRQHGARGEKETHLHESVRTTQGGSITASKPSSLPERTTTDTNQEVMIEGTPWETDGLSSSSYGTRKKNVISPLGTMLHHRRYLYREYLHPRPFEGLQFDPL